MVSACRLPLAADPRPLKAALRQAQGERAGAALQARRHTDTSLYPQSPSITYHTPMPTQMHPPTQTHPLTQTSATVQRPKLRGTGLALPPCCWLELVSLCRFRAIFHPARRPTFGPRPARYDLSPFFDRFNTPQRGRPTTDRSVPGRYDLSPFVDLSVAPQTQAGPRSSRHRPPEKTLSTIQSNSDRRHPSLVLHVPYAPGVA